MLDLEFLQRIGKDNWPTRIQEIAEYIGEDLALTLFINYAGRHLAIPKIGTLDNSIESLIGDEAAQRLFYYFGGEVLQIPNGKQMLVDLRNPEIFKDWAGGMTQADIATKYHLTERQINKIIWQQKGTVKKAPSKGRQALVDRRNKAMLIDWLGGMIPVDIADKYYLSKLQTGKIISKQRRLI